MMLQHILTKVKISSYNSGNALHELHKYNDANIMFDRAIKINPNHASAYFNKGIDFIILYRQCTTKTR